MTLRIQRNNDGSFKDNRSAHTADMFCDTCGHMQSAVNLNSTATYGDLIGGGHSSIVLGCAAIGGSCDSTTCWPLTNGVADAVELALVKTA